MRPGCTTRTSSATGTRRSPGARTPRPTCGPADPRPARRPAVRPPPEPQLLDRFTADGYDLLLAGHTHGGQVCLPVLGTLVTNCGIDRHRARGLSRHPDGHGPAWLHVSAGVGTPPWAP